MSTINMTCSLVERCNRLLSCPLDFFPDVHSNNRLIKDFMHKSGSIGLGTSFIRAFVAHHIDNDSSLSFIFFSFYFSGHMKYLFITWKNTDSSYSFTSKQYEIHLFRLFNTCEVNLEVKLVNTIKPRMLIYTVYNNIGIFCFFFFFSLFTTRRNT